MHVTCNIAIIATDVDSKVLTFLKAQISCKKN